MSRYTIDKVTKLLQATDFTKIEHDAQQLIFIKKNKPAAYMAYLEEMKARRVALLKDAKNFLREQLAEYQSSLCPNTLKLLQSWVVIASEQQEALEWIFKEIEETYPDAPLREAQNILNSKW